jgi:hypothetical protein
MIPIARPTNIEKLEMEHIGKHRGNCFFRHLCHMITFLNPFVKYLPSGDLTIAMENCPVVVDLSIKSGDFQ